MITSHELARMLLARRNHTIRVEVLVDEDEKDPEYHPQRTELRDAEAWSWAIPSEELLHYDSESDMLILRAGVIVIDNDSTI